MHQTLCLLGARSYIKEYYFLASHWRHERDGVSNHQRLDCLLNCLFRRRSKKKSKLRVTGLCKGNPPVDSPRKGPVRRKFFPFDDVSMWLIENIYHRRTYFCVTVRDIFCPWNDIVQCTLILIFNLLHQRVVLIQYIPRNMHTVFVLLCFVVVIHWLIFPYPSGLLHWHCGNLTIAPVPAKQPWWIWINTSCEFIMNDCITTTKQSTTKPCAYFLGYTVIHRGGVTHSCVNTLGHHSFQFRTQPLSDTILAYCWFGHQKHLIQSESKYNNVM